MNTVYVNDTAYTMSLLWDTRLPGIYILNYMLPSNNEYLKIFKLFDYIIS